VLNELREVSKRESVPASPIAWVYASLRQNDEAFGWLEKAYRQREYTLMFLNLHPVYDPLRSDLRFQDLLRRMKFPPRGRRRLLASHLLRLPAMRFRSVHTQLRNRLLP
jgi:hypothetical protein